MTQTTSTNGRPTVHPDWSELEQGYNELYPIDEPDEFERRFLDLDSRLFDGDAAEELPDDMGEWS